MRKWRTGCMTVIGLFVVIIAIAGITGGGSKSKKSPTRARQTHRESSAAAAARRLAATGNGSDQNDAGELTRDLMALRGKCQEPPDRLAGEISASEQDLRKHNIDLDAVDVARQLRKVASGLGKANEPTNCASLLAAYLVLREAGGGTKLNSASAPDGSSSAQATTAAASPTMPPASGRCGVITVNAHTTCLFARNVVRAYEAGPADTVDAYSPVTKLEYTMTCTPTGGDVRCVSGAASLTFRSSSAATSAGPSAPTSRSANTIEQPGGYSHATDGQFCELSSHTCIDNFSNGNGYIVQCADGEWSHSGGLSGACSDHGGAD